MAKVNLEWEEVPFDEGKKIDPGPAPEHEVTDRHWLEVYPAEDGPGAGNWNEDHDYYVTHECEWVSVNGYWYPSCALAMETDAIGADVFDPEWEDWPTPPFKVEIKHTFNTWRDYWGDWDVESYVEIVEDRDEE